MKFSNKLALLFALSIFALRSQAKVIFKNNTQYPVILTVADRTYDLAAGQTSIAFGGGSQFSIVPKIYVKYKSGGLKATSVSPSPDTFRSPREYSYSITAAGFGMVNVK